MNQIIEWRGPGWYAGCQEGAHEGQHIHYYLVDENKNARGVGNTAYRMGLGTPSWLDEPSPETHVNNYT
jgi:hypothetical protein